MIKEQMSESLIIFLANISFALWLTKNKRFAQKNVNTIVFFVRFLKNKRFAHSLFFKELCEQIGCTWKKSDCEQISQVTHQKWATVSDMNRLLTKNERISKSLVFLWANRSFAHFFEKSSDLFRKQMSEFPTLIYTKLSTYTPGWGGDKEQCGENKNKAEGLCMLHFHEKEYILVWLWYSVMLRWQLWSNTLTPHTHSRIFLPKLSLTYSPRTCCRNLSIGIQFTGIYTID